MFIECQLSIEAQSRMFQRFYAPYVLNVSCIISHHRVNPQGSTWQKPILESLFPLFRWLQLGLARVLNSKNWKLKISIKPVRAYALDPTIPPSQKKVSRARRPLFKGTYFFQPSKNIKISEITRFYFVALLCSNSRESSRPSWPTPSEHRCPKWMQPSIWWTSFSMASMRCLVPVCSAMFLN